MADNLDDEMDDYDDDGMRVDHGPGYAASLDEESASMEAESRQA